MTLHLHRAARTDQLADQLGELLASPLADPFAPEVVVVPAKGVERWLSQRLSHRLGVAPERGDGVCAGRNGPPITPLGIRTHVRYGRRMAPPTIHVMSTEATGPRDDRRPAGEIHAAPSTHPPVHTTFCGRSVACTGSATWTFGR